MTLPLYLQIRRSLVAAIPDGRYRDGDLLPSIRSLACEESANPLTVGKAYQELLERNVVRAQHGVGLFVAEGGAEKLRVLERDRFLREEWPKACAEIRRAGLDVEALLEEVRRADERTS